MSVEVRQMTAEEFLKDFGTRMRAARKRKGLSQVAAAQEMGIDYRHFQNIEGGKINIRFAMFHQLATFFGMTLAIFEPSTSTATINNELPKSAQE